MDEEIGMIQHSDLEREDMTNLSDILYFSEV